MLSAALLGVIEVFAVVACGPAAPAQQSGSGGSVPESVSAPATESPFVLQQSGDGSGDGENDEPTATPYSDDCKRKFNLGIEKWEIVCPELGSRKVDHNLRREYNDLMEEKATRNRAGKP